MSKPEPLDHLISYLWWLLREVGEAIRLGLTRVGNCDSSNLPHLTRACRFKRNFEGRLHQASNASLTVHRVSVPCRNCFCDRATRCACSLPRGTEPAGRRGWGARHMHRNADKNEPKPQDKWDNDCDQMMCGFLCSLGLPKGVFSGALDRHRPSTL